MARPIVTSQCIVTRAGLKKSSQHAFSLSEVMVGLMVIVIALFALMALQAYTLRVQKFSEERHRAVSLATSRMVRVEAALDEDFEADPSGVLTPDPEYPEVSLEVIVEPGLSEDIKDIRVRAVWQEDRGQLSYHLENSVVRP